MLHYTLFMAEYGRTKIVKCNVVISKWILCCSIILALTPLCLCEMDLFNLIGTQPKTYSGGDPCLDFDVGHFSDEESAHKVRFGTKGWTSNELWNVGERKASVDIFSLGCVYHFVITRGGHPFGVLTDLDSCQDNICSKENNFNLDDINEHYKETPYLASLARDLISKMISFYPVERPEALDVLHHPLLWTSKDRLSFFDELGKIVEEKKDARIVAFKEKLERGAANVFGKSWKVKVDKALRSDCEKYDEDKMHTLLRVIRNKIQHIKTLGPKLKEIFSYNSDGVVDYFLLCFPEILLYTYSIAREHDLSLLPTPRL
ncbi:serine/threonine-protein kinase/endoribonuclease IRE1-like [Xenia sp. Carnegie-2017]|uniref:serine/threonine-protein kinase/endoribonuclease IRE1-like n=1 Tax=Xenia sp. Carnegie-2017 TaxID=2897299 RepID=UPI001F04E8DD|nr:serine/threonine-protein kinase/endoribonuclease IRE1-like [Xenia sp. Carnegie-2017]XP_046842690.1 serine/threonine-protein kinase/endoribonuclease IRE1-like [Xenia sp. Carnegie-2017]